MTDGSGNGWPRRGALRVIRSFLKVGFEKQVAVGIFLSLFCSCRVCSGRIGLTAVC